CIHFRSPKVLSLSPHSLDADADTITHIPGNGFGTDMLQCGLPETIKTGLLVGELKLAAERTALHHLKEPCSVSLLDMMQKYFTGKAEVAALTQGIERFVLRPDLESLRMSALPNQLHRAHANLLS